MPKPVPATRSFFFLFLVLSIFGCKQQEFDTVDSHAGIKFFINHKVESLKMVHDGPNGELVYIGGMAGDAFIKVVDKDGNELWDSRIGGSNLDEFSGVISTLDNGYLAYGSTYSSDYRPEGNKGDGLLVKYAASGNVEWIKSYGDVFDDNFTDVVESSDGYFYLAGASNRNNLSTWVLKITTKGEEVWNRTFDVGPWHDAGRKIGIAPNGNILVLGLNSLSSFLSEVGQFSTYYLELETKFGSRKSEHLFTEYTREVGASIGGLGFDAVFEDDAVIWVASMPTLDLGNYIHYVKTTYDGTVLMEKKFYGDGASDVISIKKLEGGYMILGTTAFAENISGDFLVNSNGLMLMLDTKGEEIWSNSTGNVSLSQWAMGSSFVDGLFRVGGTSESKEGITMTYYIVDENGENQFTR